MRCGAAFSAVAVVSTVAVVGQSADAKEYMRSEGVAGMAPSAFSLDPAVVKAGTPTPYHTSDFNYALGLSKESSEPRAHCKTFCKLDAAMHVGTCADIEQGLKKTAHENSKLWSITYRGVGLSQTDKEYTFVNPFTKVEHAVANPYDACYYCGKCREDIDGVAFACNGRSAHCSADRKPTEVVAVASKDEESTRAGAKMEESIASDTEKAEAVTETVASAPAAAAPQVPEGKVYRLQEQDGELRFVDADAASRDARPHEHDRYQSKTGDEEIESYEVPDSVSGSSQPAHVEQKGLPADVARADKQYEVLEFIQTGSESSASATVDASGNIQHHTVAHHKGHGRAAGPGHAHAHGARKMQKVLKEDDAQTDYDMRGQHADSHDEVVATALLEKQIRSSMMAEEAKKFENSEASVSGSSFSFSEMDSKLRKMARYLDDAESGDNLGLLSNPMELAHVDGVTSMMERSASASASQSAHSSHGHSHHLKRHGHRNANDTDGTEQDAKVDVTNVDSEGNTPSIKAIDEENRQEAQDDKDESAGGEGE